MKKVKVFTLEPSDDKIYDHVLLAVDEDVISMMMSKMTYINYNKWKLKVLKKVLAERNENNDYGSDAQSRINFTIKAIEYTQHILDRYEKKD